MRLYLFGRFNSTGGGRHAENFYRGLLATPLNGLTVIPINPDDKQEIARMLVEGTDCDITLFFILANPWIVSRVKGRKILWFVFESDRIPSKVCTLLSGYNFLWVPSAWGRDVLIASGVTPNLINVVSEGVDTSVYFPKIKPHNGFIFLSIGKYEKRKGIDELVQAFSEEFPEPTYPTMGLWLKADHPLMPERILDLTLKTSIDKRIKVLGGDYPEGDLIKLYQGADAFVFPSRAEGFGLPALEAIACGIPLLSVCYSGQTEYLKEIESLYYPIQYELVPICDRDFQNSFREAFDGEDFGSWAEPNLLGLRAAMRDVYDNINLWKTRALRASDKIRSQFDWKDIAEKALKSLI